MPAKKTTKKKPAKKTIPAKMGRPTKYRPEYCQSIIDYFDIPATDSEGKANTPPYFARFAQSIGINQETLHEWASIHPNFSVAYTDAKNLQKELMINNALTGGYNASFAWRAMMNMHNWRDKSDNVHTGKGGKNLEWNINVVHTSEEKSSEPDNT